MTNKSKETGRDFVNQRHDDVSDFTSVELRAVIRHKKYNVGPTILENIDFSIKNGQVVGLLGSSGCGKTTLLRIIAGLDENFDGEIYIDGRVVTKPGTNRGVVFQESRLFPWMSVSQNVAFALPNICSLKERQLKIQQVLQLVNLASAKKLRPYQLSGGMEKRVALARALVNLPQVLLLDEPLAAVDPSVRFILQNELVKIHLEKKLATLIVTHDIDEAVQLCDRILILGGVPTKIATEIEVNLPHPRSRASTEIARLRNYIFEELHKTTNYY